MKFVAVLLKYLDLAKKSKSAIKQIYYLSTADVLNNTNVPNFKCKRNKLLLWKTYMANTNRDAKKILLLIPNGISVTEENFKIMKEFGNY